LANKFNYLRIMNIRWILGIISLLMLGFVIYKVSFDDAHIQKTLNQTKNSSRIDSLHAPVDSLSNKR